jgi:outer membrane protein assembly complex protein YaeT
MHFSGLPGARLFAILLLGAAAASAQTAAIPEDKVFDQRVVVVRVVEESGTVLAVDPPGLPLQPGKTLERDALRASLRSLYASGRYADIVAEAYPVSGGVRIDFRVRQNFFIGTVRVEGLREPPSDAQALGTLRLGLGQTFRDSDLQEGLRRFAQVLRQNGFYGAVFDPVLTRHTDTQLVDITVRVETGRRARVGALALSNSTAYPTPDLLRASRLHRGQPLTAARLDRAAERLRKWLAHRGHLGARVILRPGDYDPAKNLVAITYDVAAGSLVQIEAEGAKLSKGKLKKLVPVFQEGSLDEDLLAEGRRNIRDYFERHGYFHCEVQYGVQQEPGTGVTRVSYTIHPGDRRKLGAIQFVGNSYFRTELLRSRLSIQPAGFLKASLFSDRLLRQDEDSIRSLYVANGFAGVQVRTEVVENYHGHAEEALVRFTIEEGLQTRVESLVIAGNERISTATLLSVVGSLPGQPFSDANVASDRDNILVLYLNDGMTQALFDSRAAPGSSPNRVKLTYQIVEGPRTTVAQVLVSGYQHTRPQLITRRILLRPGEPLRQGEVVETQRDLYGLGVFDRVAIAPQNPAGDDTAKTMLVNVSEGKRFTIGYGGGIEVQPLSSKSDPTATSLSFSPRGILELTWGNFLGRAHTLEFRARASTLQGRVLLGYSAPQFLNRRNWNLQLFGFADKTRDVRTFTSTRYEGSVQLEQRLSPVTTLLYRYTYRHVLVSNLNIAPQDVPLFSQPTKISGPSFAWVRDLRDNPADPSRGRFYTVDLGLFPERLGSTASFMRIFAQNSSFTPLGHQLVFARSTRFGLETPFGSALSTEIPLAERYFAGGGSSLRGFGLNQAGPRDNTTGFPLGGLALLVSNQELRFPMRVPFLSGGVGGALFYDVGNVYQDLRHITLRPTPASPSELNYLSHSVGIGFRYATPIGPIRIDMGYLLNSPQFTLPTAPSGLAQLRRFQFFLSFGSPF